MIRSYALNTLRCLSLLLVRRLPSQLRTTVEAEVTVLVKVVPLRLVEILAHLHVGFVGGSHFRVVDINHVVFSSRRALLTVVVDIDANRVAKAISREFHLQSFHPASLLDLRQPFALQNRLRTR